jgi:hypothetical protein
VHALDVNADAEVELLSLIGTRNRYSYYSLESRADGDTEELVWEQHGPFQHEGSELNLADEWRYIAPVDANNDKLVDMVVNQGGPVRTYLNLGRCPGGQGKFGTPVYDEWGRCVAFNEEPIVSCSLYTGSGAVSFRDPGFRVADMNGDGRADLVKIQSDGLAYRLWYWPGRGNGLWGAGDRDCHSGADNEIIMDGSVGTYNRRRTSHLADVNGDGAADFIVASPGGWNRISVEVWLNRGGLSWSEPMYTRIPGASWDAELVRLADLDGSGTRDLVVGTPDSYQYIDFMGGRTPRLLHLIDNGLGGVTEIEYSSSTPYMLADRERSEAWTSTLPLAVNVVSRSVISDGQGARYVKDYAYRDPYYDSLDGRFRGFSQALVRSWGDESTPTQVQHSSFHLGERPSWLCANEATREDGSGDLECALADNPYETLGGRPYLAETRTDPEPDGDSWWTAPSAQFLQTVHTSYRVDQLFEGLDGRGVWYAWSPQQDTFAYGSQSARADESLTLPGVELRRRTAEDGADGSVVDQMDGQITLRTGTSGRAHRRARRNQDRFGRTLWQAHDGLVGYSGDERMSHQVWGYNQAAWIHRPCEGWIEGGEHDVDTRLAYTQTFYEGHENHLCEVGDRGLITFARTQLVTRQADGTAMSPRWIPQGLTDYNAQGLPANTYGGVGPGDEANALRHQRNTYDAQYGALLVAEQVQANRADQDAAYLTNSAVWDVGLGLPTAVTEHNGQTGYAQYDALGRVTAVYRPLCREPAAVYEYVISESGGLHYVHTQANEVCDSPGNPSPEEGEAAFTELNTSTGVTESYGFVDGLGRPRAALAEGDADDGFAWVLTGVVDFDARGNVRRAYDPVPLETAAEPWRLVTLTGLEVPYEERGYDPFGRPIWTTATDGSLSSRMEYGANWSHHWDGNDLDSRSRHHNTYETALVDGLGRTVVSLSRLAGDEGVTLHAATSVYDGLGNVVTVTRGEAVADSVAMGAPSVAFVDGRSTTRAILYDSLGQKTHNVDPDSGTSLYFYDRACTTWPDA